jgi:hypothetical protein
MNHETMDPAVSELHKTQHMIHYAPRIVQTGENNLLSVRTNEWDVYVNLV